MITDTDTLAHKIKNGMKIAVPADYSGISMSLTRAIIRAKLKDLHLVGVPTTGLQGELLIGAGCLKTLESSALTLSEYNPAPCFSRAVKDGSINLIDATCPAIHAGLQAAQKGIPFMPLRGIIGSDLLTHHPDWTTIQNPLETEDDPIVLIPAINPDFAVFHAPMADTDGNVWIGRRRELVHMTQASKAALVTVDKIFDGNLLEDRELSAGTIPALYVGGVAVDEQGTWPLSFWDGRDEDVAHLKTYKQLAKTEEGFQQYLDQYVLD